ncbi:MAG: DMT family transporter [Alphaproteobacteria bacterium]|nr:DMT family transporter [Alphaproteobacteria bacterium]
MTAGLLGAVCALAWGGIAFASRYPGQSLGPVNALLGLTAAGLVVLTPWLWLVDSGLMWNGRGFAFAALSGLSLAIGGVFFFTALTRGPIGIVSPIAGGLYPGFSVVIAVFLGARPELPQWAGIAVTLAGIVLVGAALRRHAGGSKARLRDLLVTAALSTVAGVCYAVMFSAAREGTAAMGQVQTTWLARVIALAATLVYFFALQKRERLGLRLRWWPFFLVQGTVDAAAFIILFTASQLPDGELAVVASSAFSAVSVLLARFVLREAVTPGQWAGVVAVVLGVGMVSAQW